jgi:hypothetical protein
MLADLFSLARTGFLPVATVYLVVWTLDLLG